MSRIIITGGSSGLGAVILRRLSTQGHTVQDWSLANIDVRDMVSVADRAAAYRNQKIHVDVLINCAGVNKLDYIENLSMDDWRETMDVNARAIWLITKSLLIGSWPVLQPGAAIINILSDAAHRPMTASIAYNASKAAAEMITRQMARELKPRYGIDVFGIAPTKIAGTAMSEYVDKRVPEIRGWTPEYAKEYEAKNLPGGQEIDPDVLADFIAYLVTKDHHQYLNGCIIPYGAS